jgi:hypothetical protein
MPDEPQQHTDPLAAALIQAALWRQLATEAQDLLDPLLEKIHALELRLDRHDCS